MENESNAYEPSRIEPCACSNYRLRYLVFWGSAIGYFVATFAELGTLPTIDTTYFGVVPNALFCTFIGAWASLARRMRYLNLAVPPSAVLVHEFAVFLSLYVRGQQLHFWWLGFEV